MWYWLLQTSTFTLRVWPDPIWNWTCVFCDTWSCVFKTFVRIWPFGWAWEDIWIQDFYPMTWLNEGHHVEEQTRYPLVTGWRLQAVTSTVDSCQMGKWILSSGYEFLRNCLQSFKPMVGLNPVPSLVCSLTQFVILCFFFFSMQTLI